MKFKRQSVSFFFFLTFGVADGRSIESRNLRCFRALADFEPRHVARHHYFGGLSVAI